MVLTGMTCPKCGKGTLEIAQPPKDVKIPNCSLVMGYYKCTKCGAPFVSSVCPMERQ